jgi:hypothetical protein
MSTDHDRLFRMEGRMTELVTVGLFGEGLRMYNSFEGRIVAGEPSGATVRGVDVFTVRPDGVGIVDGRELVTAGDRHLTADLTGYSHPPAGMVMPPLEVLLDPGFCWPDVPFTLEVAAVYRTAAPEFAELGRIPVAHLGWVNLATRELVIEGFRVRSPDRTGQLAVAGAGPS